MSTPALISQSPDSSRPKFSCSHGTCTAASRRGAIIVGVSICPGRVVAEPSPIFSTSATSADEVAWAPW